MSTRSNGADREDSDVRFARALHRQGLRSARHWGDVDFKGLSQTEAALDANVSRPTISAMVHRATRLLADTPSGLVLDPKRVGRAIGLDFGENHHRVAIGDIHGQLFVPNDPQRFETEAPAGPASLSLEWAAERVDELLRETRTDPSDVWAVGVSLPGPVSKRTSRLHTSPGDMDRSWEVVDLQLSHESELPTPTVESDFNASLLTEHLWGALRESTDALYVKVSHRCACGLLIDHRVYRGSDGAAGRLGQTRSRPDGTEGWIAVDRAFSLRRLRELTDQAYTAAEFVELAKAGGDVDAALRSGAWGLGVALAPIIDALNPESVVIGGALGSASFGWVASDLIAGITALGESPARAAISGRLTAARFTHSTALRGVIASALLERAPSRIVAAME